MCQIDDLPTLTFAWLRTDDGARFETRNDDAEYEGQKEKEKCSVLVAYIYSYNILY